MVADLGGQTSIVLTHHIRAYSQIEQMSLWTVSQMAADVAKTLKTSRYSLLSHLRKALYIERARLQITNQEPLRNIMRRD